MTATNTLRVLLVEDNELDARSMTKRLLAYSDINFEITRAPDLATATDLLEPASAPMPDQATAAPQKPAAQPAAFDCILLDLSLPDSAGLVSVEVLSAVDPNCPIVVLTGLDDPSTALEAVEQGAQDYLSKQTANSETVARSIRYAVARHHSDLALRSATDQLGMLHERERIARDLHDTVIQQLFATGIGLQSAAAAVTDPGLHGRLIGAVEGIDAAIHQLREAIFGLHTVPQRIALAEAISTLADEKAESLGFSPIVQVGPLPEDLAPTLAHEAVQVVGEALSNVAKHANASAAKIEATTDPGPDGDHSWLVICISDNGQGMGNGSAGEQLDGLTGRGLANMEERAKGLGGRCHVGPGSGGGTRIEWAVPMGTAGSR